MPVVTSLYTLDPPHVHIVRLVRDLLAFRILTLTALTPVHTQMTQRR